MKENRKSLVVCLSVPLLVGALSGFLTRGEMKSFADLTKPPLAPPAWVFPVAWTILYLLMGYVCYQIQTSPKSRQRSQGLLFYGLQLAANFLWPIFFFNAKWYFFAFGWLLLLWYLVFVTQRKFSVVSESAGKLLIPYLLWLTFAGYLNLAIAFLN